MAVYNGTGRLRKVLLCPPQYLTKAAPINVISKQHPEDLDVDKMMAEFDRLVAAYEAAGVDVVIAEPDKETPEALFARDFGAHIGEGYLLGRFASPVRAKERTYYQSLMADLGYSQLLAVGEGCFEGGDFAFIDNQTLAIGCFDRSDAQGVSEIKAVLEPLGYQVYSVPGNPDYLHLDMCFNMVTSKLAIAYTEGLPQDFLDLLTSKGIEVISGDEAMIFEHAYNVQALGDNRVLCLAKNQWMNDQLRQKGLDVIEVDIREILKAGGGIHCMTFPLEREV